MLPVAAEAEVRNSVAFYGCCKKCKMRISFPVLAGCRYMLEVETASLVTASDVRAETFYHPTASPEPMKIRIWTICEGG